MARLFVALALLLTGVAAASDDVFIVPEVPVFAEAKSSAQARRIARDQGRAAAFDLMMRRLVAEEDWVYLPEVSENRPAPMTAIIDGSAGAGGAPAEFAKSPIAVDRDQLRSYEQETNVFNEKSSGTTYRASITYRFKPDAIRSLLQRARIPYSEEQARQAMVLPVLETETGLYLWEAKNPWARAWLERPLTNELTPIVLPRGDVVDVQAITAQEARNLNTARLKAFAERYGADQLLLALGSLEEEGGVFRLTVRLIEATPPDLRDGRATAIGSIVTEAIFTGRTDDFPALARRAVETTVQRHARQWKRRTLVDHGMQRTFQLTAWFGGQREWSDIQDALASTALVVDREDGVFNNENAIFVLTVVGAEEQFRLAMAQRGLDVWQDESGRWHIAREARAAELKQTLTPLTTDIDDEAQRRRGLGRFFGRRGDPDGRSRDEVPELPDDLFGDDPGGN